MLVGLIRMRHAVSAVDLTPDRPLEWIFENP
ncbi:unnamed protein product, partial [marine sediment metagenome]